MNRGAWWATVIGVRKSQISLHIQILESLEHH